MTKAKGSDEAAMAASATSRAGFTSAAWRGKSRWGIRMVSSSAWVICPISSCCGSSPMPGWPRQVTMSSAGMRNGKLSEVSGFTALPSPEFWHITALRRPASQAPAAMPTASPSLAAPT